MPYFKNIIKLEFNSIKDFNKLNKLIRELLNILKKIKKILVKYFC